MYHDAIYSLNKIEKLKYNWNGNYALPFTKGVVSTCRQLLSLLLKEPEVFPTANNSIELNFYLSGWDLEVEVFSAHNIQIYESSIDKRTNINNLEDAAKYINQHIEVAEQKSE